MEVGPFRVAVDLGPHSFRTFRDRVCEVDGVAEPVEFTQEAFQCQLDLFSGGHVAMSC